MLHSAVAGADVDGQGDGQGWVKERSDSRPGDHRPHTPRAELAARSVDGVDGVVALTHGTGCAIPTNTEGFTYLRRTLNGYARNPNFAAILMIGLGCYHPMTR